MTLIPKKVQSWIDDDGIETFALYNYGIKLKPKVFTVATDGDVWRDETGVHILINPLAGDVFSDIPNPNDPNITYITDTDGFIFTDESGNPLSEAAVIEAFAANPHATYITDADGSILVHNDGSSLIDGSAPILDPGTETFAFTSHLDDKSEEINARIDTEVATLNSKIATEVSGLNSTINAKIATVNGSINSTNTSVSTLSGNLGTTNTNLSNLTTTVSTKAPINSPSFTGTPNTTYPPWDDWSDRIPTTGWVKDQAFARIDSPIFTGSPFAPTPATAENNTRIATTAWVRLQGYTVSDIRLKTKVRPTQRDFGPVIDAMEFVDYALKDNPTVILTGLIAQWTHQIWPELVTPGNDLPVDDPDFEPWRIYPREAILPILQELKALRARVAELERQRL